RPRMSFNLGSHDQQRPCRLQRWSVRLQQLRRMFAPHRSFAKENDKASPSPEFRWRCGLITITRRNKKLRRNSPPPRLKRWTRHSKCCSTHLLRKGSRNRASLHEGNHVVENPERPDEEMNEVAHERWLFVLVHAVTDELKNP